MHLDAGSLKGRRSLRDHPNTGLKDWLFVVGFYRWWIQVYKNGDMVEKVKTLLSCIHREQASMVRRK